MTDLLLPSIDIITAQDEETRLLADDEHDPIPPKTYNYGAIMWLATHAARCSGHSASTRLCTLPYRVGKLLSQSAFVLQLPFNASISSQQLVTEVPVVLMTCRLHLIGAELAAYNACSRIEHQLMTPIDDTD